MSSTGNDIIDDRYNTYVPYNWTQQVANAFSSAIAYTWSAIQTFTSGIKTNDIFCETVGANVATLYSCLLYTSPSPRDGLLSRMPSSA